MIIHLHLKLHTKAFLLLTTLVFLSFFPQKTLAQQEKGASYWLELAVAETNINRKIEFYREALKINPNDPETHNNLGILYKNKGLYPEAIKEYEAALKISTYHTPEFAHNNLGVIYREMGKHEKALEHFNTALKINSKFAKAYNGIGLTYKAMGKFEDAEKSFRQALDIQPDYVQAEYNLKNVWKLPTEKEIPRDKKISNLYTKGITLAEQGEHSQAIAVLEEILKLEPNHINAQQKIKILKKQFEFKQWYKAALSAIKANRFNSANNNLKRALQAATTDYETNKANELQEQISEGLAKQNSAAKASWLYEEGVEKIKQKDWLGAISDFTKLLMIDPDNEKAKEENRKARIGYYYEEAVKNINQNKWEEAKNHLQNLLALAPEHSNANKMLAKAHQQLQNDKAKYLLDKGANALNLGDWAQARMFYLEVLRISPDNKIAQEKLEQIRQLGEKKVSTSLNESSGWEEWVKPIIIIAILISGLTIYYFGLRILRSTHFISHYHQFRDIEQSRILYEKMYQEDPSRRAIYPLLAKTYHELKKEAKIEDLLQSCDKYLQKSDQENTADWMLCKGEIYQAIQQPNKAAKFMEEAFTMQPQQSNIIKKLCQLYKTILQEQDNPQITERLKQLQTKSPLTITVKKDEENLSILKECFGRTKS